MKKASLFSLWLAYLILILAGGLFIGFKGLQINTDFLSIFPDQSERSYFHHVSHLYEKKYENELILFVESPDKEEAIAASEKLAQEMTTLGIFSSVKLKLESSEQSQSIGFLYSKRKALLTAKQIELIQTGQTDQLIEKALENLYSPTAITAQFSSDPLNLFQDYISKTAASFSLKPDQGYLISQTRDKTAVFLRGQLNKEVPGFDSKLVHFYEAVKSKYQKTDAKVYAFGASLFTAFGSEKSMEEVGFYGILSAVGVSILLIWCFSSLIPIFASLLTIFISIVSGLTAVALLYSSVHVLSLLLGVSVLGIVTDYCTHFFAKAYDEKLQDSQQVIRKIKGALGIGFLTNILTYLCFYFTDLVVLEQLSIFTMVGIFTTYFTVLAVFPKLRFRKLKAQHLLKVMSHSLIWRRWSRTQSVFGIILLTLTGVLSTGGFKFNDDVRLLQDVSLQLKSDEDQVFKYLGTKPSSNYFIVRGLSPDELLVQEEKLLSQFSLDLNTLAFSNSVPSLARQAASQKLYQKLQPAVENLSAQIRLKDSKKILASFNEPTSLFGPEEFLRISPHQPIAANWLGNFDGYYYSVVNLLGSSSSANYDQFKGLESESVHLVSKAVDLTKYLKNLRESIMGAFLLVLVVLSIVLLFLFRGARAFLVLFPPTIAAVLTLVAASLIFGELNLFHVLAVILIFCLGMDYSVFFAQSTDTEVATHIGVFISFLSTIGSFGVLGLSHTTAVASFGTSVCVGICLCYFLAPIAAGRSHGK